MVFFKNKLLEVFCISIVCDINSQMNTKTDIVVKVLGCSPSPFLIHFSGP